ncbi:P-loop containing nucleoside triphosphate hydrolase protein [Abortiporus biennis]|nr:P-loop containing nucleoside triphosphate hydrolase protein [Abortiporus biennis]
MKLPTIFSSHCRYSTQAALAVKSTPLPSPHFETHTSHTHRHHYLHPLPSECPHCGSLERVSRSRFDWRARAHSRLPAHRKPQLPPADRRRTGTRRSGPRRVRPVHADLVLGEKFYEEVQAYQDHFMPLLDAEQEENEAVLKERLSSWSFERLQKEGYCITGLSAYWSETNSFGRPVASFMAGPGIALPTEHRFENGTQVLLTRLDPMKESPLRGNVVHKSKFKLNIAFEESFDYLDDGIWRLDVGQTTLVYDRMRTAVKQLNMDPQSQEFDRTGDDSDRQVMLQGTYLRDILLRGFYNPLSSSPSSSPTTSPSTSALNPESTSALNREDGSSAETETETHWAEVTPSFEGLFQDDMRIQSWATRYSEENPIVVEGDPKWIDEALNPTQVKAVAAMIKNRFCLVQGPPGTGKTKTIVECIKLLKTHFEIPHPILLCTYTNVAVDNLVEGLLKAGLKPLRVGYHAVASSSSSTVDTKKLEEHPLKEEFDKICKRIENVEKRVEGLNERIEMKSLTLGSGKKDGYLTSEVVMQERQLGILRAKAYGLKQIMLKDVVNGADVVCTTCITSAARVLNISDFPIVFIDEASMSTEPASLIPLMKGSRHVALIGDHKQLPPVITSPEAQEKGLGISLFERLADEKIVPSIMLNIQYRMHPTISHFPSKEFYDFGLRDGTVDRFGNVLKGLVPPVWGFVGEHGVGTSNRPSVIFLDHCGFESLKDRSRVNVNEAHIVCSVVEDLLLNNEGLRGQDIGIIAPYKGQVSLLTSLLSYSPSSLSSSSSFESPNPVPTNYTARFETVLGTHRAMQIQNIEIKTIDGFEGREKEVIIFSTVRNNSEGSIGFLADRRRLNVGLTRAKRGLVLVGSLETVGRGRGIVCKVGKREGGVEAWRRYAQFLDREKLVLKLEGERLRKVLYGNVINATTAASPPASTRV